MRIIMRYLFYALLVVNISNAYSQDLDKYFDMNIIELMDVEVVSATKTRKKISEAPSTIISISGKQIEEMGARTLSDVFKMVTGIHILNRRNGRDMIWIRGVTTGYNTKVLLLIDGVPQREAILGEWSTDEEIQINNIDHIEIIRGPGSALHGGNAYAGVISVFTKEEVDNNNISISMGNFNSKRVEFYSGKSVGNSKIIIAGNISETEGHPMERDRKGKSTNHKDRVEAKNIQVKFINKGFRFSITQNDFVTDYPLYAIGQDKKQYYKITNGLIDYSFNRKKITIIPKFYFYNTSRIFDFTTRDASGRLTSANESQLESSIIGFDNQFTYNLHKNNILVAGFSFERKEAEKFYEEVMLEYSKNDSVDLYEINDHYYYSWLNEGKIDSTSGPGEVDTKNYAFYLQNETRFLSNKLNLTLGLRLDDYEGFAAELSPRIGLVLNKINNFTIKSLWGRAFKPPTYRQQYAVRLDGKSPGNPNVGPERITTFEIACIYNFRKKILTRINYFNNTLTDFIESINYASYSNTSEKRNIAGIEIGLDAELTSEFTYLNAIFIFSNYCFVSSENEIEAQEFDVPSVAKHSANMGIRLKNRWITLYSGLNYIGKRNESSSYHSKVADQEYRNKDNKGSYLIWDINLALHKFTPWPVKLDLSIHNLLDREHYNPTYDPDSYYDFTKERRHIRLKISAEI